MAIYHLSVKTVSRAKGRSATAAAAYRSGTEITDNRTGKVYDYSRKTGVVHSEIILPKGTDRRFEDREVLWNEAEKSEKRKNSTVAREYEVHLPNELSAEERQELAREYGEWLSDRFEVAVDICIHEPNREGDQRNHHAHILTTTRKVEASELTTKTRELDEIKSNAVEEVREKWADMTNRYLERAQTNERVDHRSYERQGREDSPTIHLGPKETAKERRGEHTLRGDFNRVVKDARQVIQNALKELKTIKDNVLGGRSRLGGLLKKAEAAQRLKGTGTKSEKPAAQKGRLGGLLKKAEAERVRQIETQLKLEKTKKIAERQQELKTQEVTRSRGSSFER